MSIILDGISKAYDTGKYLSVVRIFSLEIETGELFVLLGASGSGKSTLLKLIAGLISVDAGRIWLNGRDVTNLPPQKRNTGFVFQNYSLFRHMTIAENIEFGLSIRNASRKEREHRVDELLSLIGLPGYGDRHPAELSGGQQQRIAIARALAFQPEVLLLDEPFGALDAQIRVQIRENLREIQQRLNVTTILVTHDQDEAFALADRIGIIEQGDLLEVGDSSELYRRPQNRFTATFLGTANLLNGFRNGHQVYVPTNDGKVSLPAPEATEKLANQPVEILSRPEEVALSLTAEAVQGQLLGRGVVETVNFGGSAEKIAVRLCADNQPLIHALISPSEARRLNLAPGIELWVGLKDYHLIRQEAATN